jgi:hypothetical protein
MRDFSQLQGLFSLAVFEWLFVTLKTYVMQPYFWPFWQYDVKTHIANLVNVWEQNGWTWFSLGIYATSGLAFSAFCAVILFFVASLYQGLIEAVPVPVEVEKRIVGGTIVVAAGVGFLAVVVTVLWLFASYVQTFIFGH